MEITTAAGPAQAEVDETGQPAFLLVLTHGAGGGVTGSDLMAASAAARGRGGLVVRVLQPYRVRGARAPGSAPRQDAAWLEIIAALRERHPGLPLVQGGRSNGARVACRTAQAAGAVAVIALAFPLHLPGKALQPESSRAGELRSAGVPVLVINGDRDPFGVPDPADADRLVVLAGQTHALSGAKAAITSEVSSWLAELPIGSAIGVGKLGRESGH
ncbi:MAG TPA: alpha/beta family hydrolase [Streptosporangiaceae bacterium]|nr:alpha/beta family hydrolase [Streptosporangiaceae bacterium]